jgi:hypothetical protein
VKHAKLAPDIRTGYTAQMPTSDRLAVSRRIAAPADRIFALITDPAGQVAIDGSGMLVVAPDATPVRAVGDSFVMDMDREPLGDLPMGKYTVLNTVTAYEQDRHVAWAPGGLTRPPVGHVYGFILEPAGDGVTEVTNYCDWSAISDKARERLSWPVVPAAMLEKSLVNLERAVTGESMEGPVDRIAVTRRIPASAARIFALITDPAGQVAIDGSGMLVIAPDATPVRAVGDSFAMDMDRAPLGGDAKYTMVNTITVFDQDHELAWSPALPGRPTVGHIYGFSLTPVGDDATEVTNYCDWSAITDAARERLDWPVVPAAMLEQSLVKLGQALSGGPAAT